MTKQEVIKILKLIKSTVFLGNHKFLDALDCAVEFLKQPEPCEDAVSRSAAIDALTEYGNGRVVYIGVEEAVRRIEQLPSAQPEIIHCRDCKHWLPHEQFGFDESNEEYHDYCERLIPEDEYYAFYRDADEWCSRAERREEGDE